MAAGLLLCGAVLALTWLPRGGDVAVVRLGSLSVALVLAVGLAVAAQLYWRTTGEAAGCLVSTGAWLLVAACIGELSGLGVSGASATVVWSLRLQAAAWFVWATVAPDIDSSQRPGRQLLVATGAALVTGVALHALVSGTSLAITADGAHQLLAAGTWFIVAALALVRAARGGSMLLGFVAWMAVALLLSALAGWLGSDGGDGWRALAAGLAVCGLLTAAGGAAYGLFRQATARRDELHRATLMRREEERDLDREEQERSHEIRTAILAIEGATLTLQRNREHLPSERQQHLDDAIRSGIRHLRELLGREPAVTESLPLFEVVEEQTTLARARGMSITVTGDRSVRALVTRTPLVQALTNVLTNAERHAGRGGDVEVAIRVARDATSAIVRIRDDGPGIAPADRERIFERASQVGNDRSGDGLGLYLSRELLRQQGGEMWVEPAPEGGADFVLSLQLAEAALSSRAGGDESDDGVQVVEPTARPAVGTDQPSPTTRVRPVVEDERDLRRDG